MMKDIQMRWINFGGGLLIGVLSGAIGGLVLGVSLGDLNAHIDFCSDGGSYRYIHDSVARRDVC